MGIRDTFNRMASDPKAQTAGASFKKLETGVWKVLDPIGRASNKIAGRLGAEAFWPTELAEGEIDKAARILRTFSIEGARADEGSKAEASGGVATAPGGGPIDPNEHRKTQKVVRKIPEKAIQGACGIAIFTCFRTGFGWSGAGGSGVVMARLPDGSWGPPSGLLVHTLGWGLLVGLDIYDVVLVIRKPETLKAFTHPKVSVGGELSVAAGPVGNGAMIDSGLEAKPVWSYSKSKGVYAGLQLDGTIILKRDDANARFYGQKVTVADIFQGKVRAPPAAKPLMQTLYAAEGRPDYLGTDAIPQGLTPGDIPVSEDDFKNADAQVGPGHGAPQQGGVGYGATGYGQQTGHGSGGYGGAEYGGAAAVGGAAAAGAAASSNTFSSSGTDSKSGYAQGAHSEDAVPPPTYNDAEAYTAPPPPDFADNAGPRDAVAEKEALRRQYAQQDATASTAGGYGGGSSVSGSAALPAHSSHPSRVRAAYDFTGVEHGDLTFHTGEVIDVTGMEGDQWYRGSITSNGQTRSGIFPANYVTPL